MKTANLLKELEYVDDYWSPRVVGRVNDQFIKGTMHNPVADQECWITLIETVSRKHTGDVVIDQTQSIEKQLGES